MAAYAESFGILYRANIGAQTDVIDAETAPLRDPEHCLYDLNLPDIAELWRRGSVIASSLLDLSAAALLGDPTLGAFAGFVWDSGEGRWTIKAAIDDGVPVPVRSIPTIGSARKATPNSNTGCSPDAVRLWRTSRNQAFRRRDGFQTPCPIPGEGGRIDP
jgi:6-phosphogluconate dehydrogenase (decarboxylating)